ncbi:MAG: HNH endonuclease domain-containing protein [Bacteroidales bacterium]
MRKILGLDLGTNSIGSAVITYLDVAEHIDKQWIEFSGSRIIPMDAAVLGDFDKGNSKSQTAERTSFRGIRRLRERSLLRRERLHRVLYLLGFLPEHYVQSINFDTHPGKYKPETECKLPWKERADGRVEFIFLESFREMLADFANYQPQLVANGKKVPYDWTLYYLRKKALTQKISKEELAWILLNFNQKRGYYQLRGEDEQENYGKKSEFYALKVVKVEASNEKRGKDTWYNVYLENGWIYRRTSSVPLDWCGKIKEFIVTTELNEDGTCKQDKEGNVKPPSFRMPQEGDWTLVKKKTEADIENSNKTIGCYIYDTLLINPNQKIKGKLVRTIERKYYKRELIDILKKQKEFHEELRDRQLYELSVKELYPQNETHRDNIINRDLTYLFIEDIIFYQRPLKRKKNLIDDCPYEERSYKVNGQEKTVSVKCIAKSHPLFQEFRLWHFISSIKIYQKERRVTIEEQPMLFSDSNQGNVKLQTDVDVTTDFLKSEDDYVALFDWLNNRKEIDQKAFLKYSPFGLKKIFDNYRWNYVEDKAYPCNETRALILSRLEKAGISIDFLTREKEEKLWHILYSVEDKSEIERALTTFANQNNLPDDFVTIFCKCPPLEKKYGAYSAKALKKLLPLMRRGKYWDESQIDDATKIRIDKIVSGEWDENIQLRVREKAIHLTNIADFRALPLWLSCYVVYNRHSEVKNIEKWHSPADIDLYLKTFKQHSLRNPIVEQVITETLRTVRDIWNQVGQIDEIHVELGREMKNPADKRKQMTLQSLENENANLRVKVLLKEFLNPEFEVENVRPYSPSQQEILRIYEDCVLNSVSDIPDEIDGILKRFKENDSAKRPTSRDVLCYKLWLEQKYRSPYTGEIIPLGKLFTSAYEIEHVIPQSRYFDDSFNNKVICESEVNKLKDNFLGYEFIKKHKGEIVELAFGKKVKIFSVEAYEQFVKDNYSKTHNKMKKLLMDDIPDQFIERQLNDSRYISKVIKGLLSNIVREKDENGNYEQEAISKNVIACTGGVTDRLKKEWGVNDVWNEIILPRFIRLNELTDSTAFTATSGNKEIPVMPLELQKGFNKKRIDHRHHAMDAIIIACSTRNLVNYLSNESASKNARISRFDLQRILCDKIKIDNSGNYKWVIKKPWETFNQDIRVTLENMIVSVKHNQRVINKTMNCYEHYYNGEKVTDKQVLGDHWAIRKPMHKDTVFGRVNIRKIKTVNFSKAITSLDRIVNREFKIKLKELIALGYDNKELSKYFKENADIWADINLSKIEIYYFTDDELPLVAVRNLLDSSFTVEKIKEKVTDTGIQKILLRHLENNGGDTELAFSPDGIDEMNCVITDLNHGKFHQPIIKVRVCEPLGNKFQIGSVGNKFAKFAESAKGTNLFFAIYQSANGKRSYSTVPLNIVIEREKQGKLPVPEINENGDCLRFWLSPNDFVYVPTKEELINGKIDKDNLDRNRIYKMVSCTKKEVHFMPVMIANPIVQTVELGSNNKAERAWTDEMIKEICILIEVDRLGKIIKIIN